MIALNDMSRDELQAWVIDLLADMFELDKAGLTADSNLYADLDIDSIDAVDLILKLKDLTGRKIQPQTFRHVRTIGDVIEAIQSVMAQNPAA